VIIIEDYSIRAIAVLMYDARYIVLAISFYSVQNRHSEYKISLDSFGRLPSPCVSGLMLRRLWTVWCWWHMKGKGLQMTYWLHGKKGFN